ncbi:hypothetical protein [Nocardia macrotermitis]|uniref:Fibronectin type-III domain-containing protein n=1 Tax=Nocardia macrotermitis TaxID=2585198 RepID=A0A7K0DEJ4_9NOCA|nr:hypothetical protein [Nocardia macrotermitis]MQY24088.1 hypothetical protein [Nocardia macrotermitis]
MRDGTREVLRVVIDTADPDVLDVRWSPASETASHKIFEYARVFLIEPDSARRYLDLVDGRAQASVRLPADLPPGEYAIEIDAYAGASWGDGKLDARGRSASFTVG